MLLNRDSARQNIPEDFVLVGSCHLWKTTCGSVPADRLVSVLLSTMPVCSLCDRGPTRSWSQRVLYMARITAIRTFYTRLVVRGKPQKVAVVAAMHALLPLLNAVMRDQTP